MLLLDVRDIRVHYGTVEAVKGISLKLEEAEVVAVLGANGAGKSTILKTISGLKHSTSGEIWFRGERIDTEPPQNIVRKGITHVPEGRRVFYAMSVLENLLMGGYTAKGRLDLETLFKRFPVLKERRRQAAGTLSGGEQQMLAFARALVSKPELVLMDEPSLGLSPMMVEMVAKTIKEINQDGVSILLVEQNARMALQLARRAYVLEVGKISLEGDSKELLNNEDVKRAYLGG